MSGLLNSLRSSTTGAGRQSSSHDDHGADVAELLKTVSQRSMSTTQEEKQELDRISKRVREHNNHKPPNPVDFIQKKLSEIQMGSNKSNEVDDNMGNNDNNIMASPNNSTKPKLNMETIASPLNNISKDVSARFSKLKTQISQAKMQVEERIHSHDATQRRQQPSQQQRTLAEATSASLRASSATTSSPAPTPTIVALPPLEPKMTSNATTTTEKRQEDESSSSSDPETSTEPSAVSEPAARQDVFVIGDESDEQEDEIAGTKNDDDVDQGEEKKQDL